MSTWIEIENDDIDVDSKMQEVHILYGSDNWGNNYISLKFDQIFGIYDDITRKARNSVEQ